MTPLAHMITQHKIVQLIVRRVPRPPIARTGPVRAIASKHTKHFDCVVTLDNGERLTVGFVSPEPPSIEAVQRTLETRPRAFSRA